MHYFIFISFLWGLFGLTSPVEKPAPETATQLQEASAPVTPPPATLPPSTTGPVTPPPATLPPEGE